nr:serine hydrolase [uncultured Ligilactobacillus sp.]
MKFLKKAQKAILVLMATLMVAICVPFNSIKAAETKNDTNQDLKLDVKGAIAIDEKTGQVLFAQNATEALPVASLSKLLTLYIVLDEIKAGKLSWDQKITPDKTTAEISQDTSLSNVPLRTDKQYTVKSLYEATLIYSANGAAMALAQAVAGSQSKFVDMMRKQVKKFGIKDAEIYTCNGLNNEQMKSAAYPGAAKDAENKFSAKDMAIISMKLLHKYPEVLKTASVQKKDFDNGNGQTVMENWNWMLPGQSSSYELLPVDGLKTGTSDAAGACFVGTVNKDGHRLITVVLGAQHNSDTDNSRFVQTQKLMSYVYNTYNYVTLDKGQEKASLPVYHGKEEKVKVQSDQAVGIWLKKGTSKKDITAKAVANKKLTKDGALEAPLKEGQTVGKIKLEVSGKTIKTVSSDIELNAQTTTAVKKANIFEIIYRSIFK